MGSLEILEFFLGVLSVGGTGVLSDSEICVFPRGTYLFQKNIQYTKIKCTLCFWSHRLTKSLNQPAKQNYLDMWDCQHPVRSQKDMYSSNHQDSWRIYGRIRPYWGRIHQYLSEKLPTKYTENKYGKIWFIRGLGGLICWGGLSSVMGFYLYKVFLVFWRVLIFFWGQEID